MSSPMGGKLMLEVRRLGKIFSLSNGRRIRAVNNVSLLAEENEILGIVGESGCGKSTLGRLILRLVEPSSGQIFFRDKEISHISQKSLRPMRRNMQMIFQNPFASFNPKIRIGRALAEVCRYYGMNAGESRDRIKNLLADMSMAEDLLYHWPRELSGGQLQRLAIVRALLSEPYLIIADEPLSSLDVSVQAQLLNLLEQMRKTRSMVMIFISHNMTVVEYLCDRTAVMYMGSIMELVSSSELRLNALHPYTRSLRASAPQLDVFKARSGEEDASPVILKGETPNPLMQIHGCPFAMRCPEVMSRCKMDEPELLEVSAGHWVRCFRCT
ncbi:MAG: ABC transporter ATP-binding protein [Treponema sp.]|nr:ABC transporter ATP-binding protein [Treponema sp.]